MLYIGMLSQSGFASVSSESLSIEICPREQDYIDLVADLD